MHKSDGHFRIWMLWGFLGFFMFQCNAQTIPTTSKPITHEVWNRLLQKHVQEDGLVNYSGFKLDYDSLKIYLDLLQSAHPHPGWTKEERLAYWINAYNAFTIDLIVRNYPCISIKDLAGSIYKVNTPWDIRFIQIQGIEYDLNNIEHDILRKEFNEPRIHFAINCASLSCPVLRNQAYTASSIHTELDEAARRFINDPSRNIISENQAQLSKIFQWFRSDFTKAGSLAAFISQYNKFPLKEKIKINYLEYNWLLNDSLNNVD